jgi:predicted aspartyl protease
MIDLEDNLREARKAKSMGRFSVDFEVANHEDIVRARIGLITDKQVRRVKLRGVVDPGATRLVLPKKVADRLGVDVIEKVKVRYADRSVGKRDLVGDVYVQVQGRRGVFSAIVGPKRRSALIGAIILEDFDFMVDCANQRLVPRDPRFIVSEIE